MVKAPISSFIGLFSLSLTWKRILESDMEFFWLSNATKHQGLSTHSFSAGILPEPRLPIFPKEPIADKLLKLLLPSLKVRDFLAFLSLDELLSPLSWSASSQVLIFATTRQAMVLRQNGHTGGVRHSVVGLGLLWQQRARVHCAHIWWPQFWTSMVHTCSKHMQHRSKSLSCNKTMSQWILWSHALNDMINMSI